MLKDSDSPFIQAFTEVFQNKKNLVIDHMWDVAKAYLTATLSSESSKNILLITDGMEEMKMKENLTCFSDRDIFEFPSWETLPGELLAPSPDIIGRRMQILHALAHSNKPFILMSSLQSVLQKTIDKNLIKSLIVTWHKGTKINFSDIDKFFLSLGYEKVAIVSDKGQFAKRGGIVDVFVTDAANPYRIEFFGNEIDNLRTFDAVGQKSIEKIDRIFICPAKEIFIMDKEKNSSLLIDYLNSNFIVIYDDLLSIENLYASLKNMNAQKNPYFISFEDFWGETQNEQKIFFSKQAIEELSEIKKGEKPSKYFEEMTFEIFHKKIDATHLFSSLMNIETFLAMHTSEKTEWGIKDYLPLLLENRFDLTFFYDHDKDKSLIDHTLQSIDINPTEYEFIKDYISSSLLFTDSKIAYIASSAFTKRQKIDRPKYRGTYHTPAAEFFHLEPGDMVVHYHSGIGKYLGIETQQDINGNENEFLVVEYAEKSKLFVPLSQAHLVSKYIGSQESLPKLNALGSNKWQRTKSLAQKQIIGYASELLELYASRNMQTGFAYPQDSEEMHLFELDFPYVATKDQAEAILSIKQDLLSKKPMDRLVCGDVGYGKTEVAMRAAFKAAFDGRKQVAVLVPTTVLALQHYDTFCQRMAGYPIRIAAVSRFNTTKENKQILAEVAQGKVDILIGTHRLLSKDVHFNDLGLIIIDEEQRFGVRAKEYLKKMKKEVDCLTLSATPIPRTLYFSLIQARDLSTINSPPQDRLPIKTTIAEEDDELIKNALLRELLRQGQSFIVHNRIETIYKRKEQIQKLLPHAKILIVHGQMHPDDIDKIFHEFKQGQADILITTTIIENGVDIPNANTIIIYRADTFGLADLYQLRGRVGRWNKTAYAYLITPPKRELQEISRKRLNVLLEAGGYGGGMKIAMRDLEIRGAGDILGVKQSGQVSAIGFHLYCKLLKKTMSSLKNKTPTSFIETKIEIPVQAYIPNDYINETNLRMEIYYRLGEASSIKDLQDLLSEVEDRYGKAPEPFLWLYHIARLRLFASQHQFLLLKMHRHTLYIERQEKNNILKKTLLLPHLPHTPEDFANYMIEKIKQVLD